MIEFLTHFRCYLEGSQFEIVTDNQVLKHFFDKKDLSRREARWLERFSDFGIFPITLKQGSTHVLGGVLSRAKDATQMTELQNITCISADLAEQASFKDHLKTDQVFGPILKLFEKGGTHDRYQLENGVLRLATGELYVPRKSVRLLLRMAHDALTSGHFGVAKTLGRLSNYHWSRKSKDVHRYVKGFLDCQHEK